MESQKQRQPVQRGRGQTEHSKRADVGSRQICLPLTQEQYDDIWNEHSYHDNWLENLQISASTNGTSGT